jgi:hypothetical protein
MTYKQRHWACKKPCTPTNEYRSKLSFMAENLKYEMLLIVAHKLHEKVELQYR